MLKSWGFSSSLYLYVPWSFGLLKFYKGKGVSVLMIFVKWLSTLFFCSSIQTKNYSWLKKRVEVLNWSLIILLVFWLCSCTVGPVLSRLKELGPSSLETELRSFSPEGGGSVTLMQQFLKLVGHIVDAGMDFESAQAYLGLFLKVNLFHSNIQIQNSFQMYTIYTYSTAYADF